MAAAAFSERYGPWALVAGAGEGIGQAFARALAARGLDLILVDLDAAKADRLADRLARDHGRRCLAVPLDLGGDGLLAGLDAAVGDRDVGLVVYNAARSSIGPFLDQPLDDKLAQLAVNCRGPLLAAHHFGPRLAARGRGGLILLSSLAAIHGHRLTASYAATKAFNAILAESLWDEWADAGVDVLAVCPGMTRTPGFVDSQPALTGLQARLVSEPDQVAARALDALGRGPRVVIGAPNRLVTLVNDRLLPRGLTSRWLGRVMDRVYPRR